MGRQTETDLGAAVGCGSGEDGAVVGGDEVVDDRRPEAGPRDCLGARAPASRHAAARYFAQPTVSGSGLLKMVAPTLASPFFTP